MKVKLSTKNEETDYDKKEDVSEELKLPVNLMLKDILELFQNTENAKGKMVYSRQNSKDSLSRFLSPGYSIKQ